VKNAFIEPAVLEAMFEPSLKDLAEAPRGSQLHAEQPLPQAEAPELLSALRARGENGFALPLN
jgi:hypothetical protein